MSNLKAIIPHGQTEITINGLHQWDYGRKLEIHASDLPAIIEVHFACAGMGTAVVRSCAVIEGVAEVAIPNRCLESSTPITAWIYAVGETSGVTIKTLTLSVIARMQPQPAATISEDVSDKYTEAIAAMTTLVGEVDDVFMNATTDVLNTVTEAIAEGSMVVAEATHAGRAESATSADTAKRAGADANGRSLSDSMHAAKGYTKMVTGDGGSRIREGVVIFKLQRGAVDIRIITEVGDNGGQPCYSQTFHDAINGDVIVPLRLVFRTPTSEGYTVSIQKLVEDSVGDLVWETASNTEYPVTAYYKHLSVAVAYQ